MALNFSCRPRIYSRSSQEFFPNTSSDPRIIIIQFIFPIAPNLQLIRISLKSCYIFRYMAPKTKVDSMRSAIICFFIFFFLLRYADALESNSANSFGVNAASIVTENVSSAVKIAGLVAFVANACSNLKPDYDKFEAIIAKLGLETKDLSNNDLKLKYLSYTSIYQQDIKGNCEKAKQMFGENGIITKGLFINK